MSAKFQVGQVWRAKRPANSGGFVNDRVIGYISSSGRIQYDSPAVAPGRLYPKVDEVVFEKWAGRLLDEKELTAEEWAPFNFQDRGANK